MTANDKAELRRRLLAARRAVAPAVRAAEADALAGWAATLPIDGDTVCAYVPVGVEPGSATLLDALVRRGVRVLVPVVGGVDEPLRWAEYRQADLVTGPFGLREPPGPGRDPATLAEAALVLVPALAVDGRGVRLGRGGGYYDRSLPLRDPRAAVVAVVRDEELLAAVPAEAHDVRMSHALTPARGLIGLTAGRTGMTPAD
ncbi:5-formyltetrahydrofolate cyclo-ligase [Mycobacterium sp. 1274756.6]|uniref:5-formyltetrahydrofolate cyclo-ligase n=1 Tax=Mycobacterium sp. 1274756.6 TaxID=1834076 RepID=UPI000801625A|nr:5-formyltetrahydrofolate cyclo-ligase [Mycobacterium sp. 1274756.6]OBJ67962.1 5-formyltetrahydrofolate cyclo-ligase [Mycobacterium sp. 1274756.6]